MFDSGRSYFLGRSHIRLAPLYLLILDSNLSKSGFRSFSELYIYIYIYPLSTEVQCISNTHTSSFGSYPSGGQLDN